MDRAAFGRPGRPLLRVTNMLKRLLASSLVLGLAVVWAGACSHRPDRIFIELEDGGGGDGGESGAGGRGGSGGASGGSSGSGGANPSCVAQGETCAVSGDCCGFGQG